MKRNAILTTVCLFLFLANSLKAQVGSAQVSLQDGKLDKAKEAIDKALQNEKDAKKSKTWFIKGEVYSAIASSPIPAYANLDKNAAQTAYQAYKKAMELEPQQKGYYKDAEASIKNRLYPSAINQGVNLYKAKDFANSLKALDVAIEVLPNDTTAIYYASAIAWEGKEYDKFIGYGEKIEEMKFNPATLKLNTLQLAYLYAGEKKDNAKAIATLERGIQKYPNELDFWKLLGDLYEQQGDREKTIQFYEKASKQFPQEAEYHKRLGFAYFNRAVDFNKEINKKKEAEGLTGELKDPKKQQKAREYNALVDAEIRKAIPFLEKADQVKPGDFETMNLLRDCYEVLGMKEKKAEMDKKIKAIGKE
ncbi:MAG: tetratricopeptide repeat protein [Raineya sp.]